MTKGRESCRHLQAQANSARTGRLDQENERGSPEKRQGTQ